MQGGGRRLKRSSTLPCQGRGRRAERRRRCGFQAHLESNPSFKSHWPGDPGLLNVSEPVSSAIKHEHHSLPFSVVVSIGHSQLPAQRLASNWHRCTGSQTSRATPNGCVRVPLGPVAQETAWFSATAEAFRYSSPSTSPVLSSTLEQGFQTANLFFK